MTLADSWQQSGVNGIPAGQGTVREQKRVWGVVGNVAVSVASKFGLEGWVN